MSHTHNKAVSELLHRIKKKYHYTAFIKCVEYGKKGNLIHTHIILFNIGFINPKWLNKQLNLLKLGRIKKIKEFKGNLKPALRYFFKYLSKSIKYNNENDIPNNLYLSWALNNRLYSLSILFNRLLEFYKNNSEKLGYIYLGIFEYKGILGHISDKEAYQLGYYIEIT